MKKLILILSVILSFGLYAEEAQTAFEADFSLGDTASDSADFPRLVIHREGILNMYNYMFSNGESLSHGEVNKLLEEIPENNGIMTKSNVWSGASYAFLAGFCTSVAINAYANTKGWSDMTHYSIASGLGCLAFAMYSRMASQSYRSVAVDNYNLSVMGISLN